MANDKDSSTSAMSVSNQDKEIRARTAGEDQSVPFLKLFYFTDRFDVGFMIIGTISAVASGLTQPIMTLIFGKLINTFGGSNRSDILHEVSKVAVLFLYLAVGSGIASFLLSKRGMKDWVVYFIFQRRRPKKIVFKAQLSDSNRVQ
ncbi:ABC transporter B family protein [Quillaja saponaria]|uniref:ABC transporter B family protein n=1 Tax=Quillaja saponaria TaxID=32244 RepID=A0AAD7LA60_QUISA|nr:ABC transporter B family protein [Quillaja saponaria]